jgi:hypothetical protein
MIFYNAIIVKIIKIALGGMLKKAGSENFLLLSILFKIREIHDPKIREIRDREIRDLIRPHQSSSLHA